MTITRRTFLGHMAASSLVPTIAGSVAAERLNREGAGSQGGSATHRIERLGLQLYTVRTEMEKDFEGTLAKVAGAGYQEVEFAGYFNQSPSSVRAILDR